MLYEVITTIHQQKMEDQPASLQHFLGIELQTQHGRTMDLLLLQQ